VHPKIPATGGICEGFAIELSDGDAKSEVSREVSALSGPAWVMRPFGDRDTDYELRQSNSKLSTAEAWDRAYLLRGMAGVAYVEPLFALSVSDNPAWARDPGSARATQKPKPSDGHLPESLDPEWSLGAIRANEASRRFFPDSTRPPGHGVVIGHPDTGYQDHPELEGRILSSKGYDFLYEVPDAHDDLERPITEPIPNPGHGTGTASVIVSPVGGQRRYPGNGWVTGVAPGAEIIPLRTAHSVMLLSTANLARAIEYATTQGAHVISISMGGLFSWRLRRAVMFARSHGVIVCAAAGNFAPFVGWPAAYDEVIACAASNARGGTWRWGCRGRAVDVTAPGESVWRATVRKEGSEIVYDVGRGSGTSLATTTTAGVAAMWLSYHGRASLIARYGEANLPLVFNLVLGDSCVKFPGWKQGKFGAGLVDAFRMLDAPLPDLSSDGSGGMTLGMDAHPEIDRGGLTTFAHLFRDGTDSAGDDSAEDDITEGDLRRALAALLCTSPHALPASLSETGQELAFHLATDPSSYRSFMAILKRGREAETRPSVVEDDPHVIIPTDPELDVLRESLLSRASSKLRLQLAERKHARATPTVVKRSRAPHL
jgi:serine protease